MKLKSEVRIVSDGTPNGQWVEVGGVRLSTCRKVEITMTREGLVATLEILRPTIVIDNTADIERWSESTVDKEKA